MKSVYRSCLVSEMSHLSIHAASESCHLCDHTGNCSRWKTSANCQQQFGQFELFVVLSQMSRLLWVLPSSPHVCEHSDQADHSDSWQLTGHSTTQEMFICHFFSKFNCSTRGETKIHDTSSNHSVTAQPTQSVTARQQLDLSALQFPEAFCFGRGQTAPGSIRPAELEHRKAAVKCVFVNEPEDEVGQGLNSCGDGSATARRLQLQGAEAHYEWIKRSAWSNDNSLCMWIFHVAAGQIVLEGHDNVL